MSFKPFISKQTFHYHSLFGDNERFLFV